MSGFIIRRLAQAILTILVVSVIVFGSLHLAPGDPAIVIGGNKATEEQLEQIRRRFGLDQPFAVQYIKWLSRVAIGDFGLSQRTNRPVAPDLISAFKVSLQLGAAALFLAVVLGIPLGILAALKRKTPIDTLVMTFSVAGMSIPGFWLALLLVLLFSLYLGLLPSSGWGTWKHLILPAFVLALSSLALFARMTRATMSEGLLEDYVLTARAGGVPEHVIVFNNTLRNVMLPIVTVIGLRFGFLVAGAVITETVFAIPGAGRLLVSGVSHRDFPVVQGTVLLISLAITLINLIVDLLYGYLDPRIRYD